MDEIDTKIIKILSDNANATATEISASVNLSIPAINKRIQKLQKEGYIRKFTILTDGENVGKPIMAFILIVLQPNYSLNALMKHINNDPDILECFAVTGEYDYLLKVCAADVKALEDKLLCLKQQRGVIKSHTMLSLMEYKLQPTILPDIKTKGGKQND